MSMTCYVCGILIKDDIPVYHDILTLHVNFRILPTCVNCIFMYGRVNVCVCVCVCVSVHVYMCVHVCVE